MSGLSPIIFSNGHRCFVIIIRFTIFEVNDNLNYLNLKHIINIILWIVAEMRPYIMKNYYKNLNKMLPSKLKRE